MAKKINGTNIENKLITKDNFSNIFKSVFLPAVSSGKLYLENSNTIVVLEVGEVKYKIPYSNFLLFLRPSLEYIYEDINRNLSKEPDINMVREHFEWSNPIFSKMDIRSRDDFMNSLKGKINSEKENKSTFFIEYKKWAKFYLTKLDDGRRKEFLEYLNLMQIFDKNELMSAGYYDDFSIDKLCGLRANGDLSNEDVESIANIQYMLEIYKSQMSKKKPTKLRKLLPLMSKQDVVDLFFNNMVSVKDLKYSGIKKEDLFHLKYETLIAILSENEKFPGDLRITSKDIINQYGRNITGNVLYKLINYGYVQDEDVIDVISINEVLRRVDYDEDFIFDDTEVSSFYNAPKIMSMYRKGKLTPEFVSKYKNGLKLEENQALYNEKSEIIIYEAKKQIDFNKDFADDEKSKKLQDTILDLHRIGMCSVDAIKGKISEEYIEELYLENRLETGEILYFYKNGIIGDEAFAQYYSEDEIFNLYLNSKISLSDITIIKDNSKLFDKIMEAYFEEKMPIEDIMVLYFSYNVLTVSQIQEIIDISSEEIDVAHYINEETSFEKIKELFENYVIDYSSLTVFKEQGIINEEEFDTIRETIDKNRFFDNLEGKVFKVVTDRKTKRQSRTHGVNPRPEPKYKDNFTNEKELISKLLKIDNAEFQDCALIESYNENGRPTTLNNYKIIGDRKSGLVIFSKFEKENAVFVMPFYQAAFFLKEKNRDKSENSDSVEISDRMKDKAYLKTLNQVSVLVHTENFARNLVEAVCNLSPELEQDIRTEDGYVEEVQTYVDNMRREYRLSKGLEIEEKD